jgi:hypothetical protein
MGGATVGVCGHNFEGQTLDGLDPDFRTNRVSIPQLYWNTFGPDIVKKWTQKCIDNPYVTVMYNVKENYLQRRGLQKFKVLDVRVCSV